MRSIFMALVLGALALGCGERAEGVDLKPLIVDRARLGSELLFLDASRNQVDAIDVMQATPSAAVARIAVRANPRLMVERSGGVRRSVVAVDGTAIGATSATSGVDPLELPVRVGSGASSTEVLVLSDGRRDAGGDYVELPSLAAIDAQHNVRNYELSAPFGQLLISSDARYALLWGQSPNVSADDLLSNPNRVALIDLSRAPSTENPANPYERTLKVNGSSVSNALITPPLSINAAVPRSLVLFTFDNGFSVWDTANPQNEDITIEGLGGKNRFALKRLIADATNAQLYLIQDQEADLRVLSFGQASPSASNDFLPSWNQLQLGLATSSDMVLFTDISDAKVLVAAGNALAIVQANNSRVATVTISTPATHLYSFVGGSPNDNDQTKQRVLAWSTGGTSVSFVELGNLEKAGSQNIEVVPLGYALTDLVPLSGNLMLTILNGGGVGTLDLDSRRFRPLAASVQLSAPLIESDARRVWVGGSNADNRIAYFEPATLATGSVRLDSPVQDVFQFENATERRVVVTHDNPVGELTIVDGTKATRASSRVLTGFLADGLVK